MVDTKKPVKPITPATAVKPAAVPANITRHSIPPLSPLPSEKPSTASVQADVPASTTAAPEKATQPASVSARENAAPSAPDKPASADATPAALPVQPSKPEEKIGMKIRKRDEILKALRNAAHVERIDGLYRIVHQDGKMNATSKRRILSLQSQKLLVASADGKTLTLDKEADAKARVPKAAATPSTPKPESSTSAKPEETK